MTTPEFIGPRPIDELTVEEFARAEITHYIIEPNKPGAATYNELGVRELTTADTKHQAARSVFFKATGQGQPDSFHIGITALTANVIGNTPELVNTVRDELVTLLGQHAVKAEETTRLERYAERQQASQSMRMEYLRRSEDRQRLRDRMRRAGHGAEPLPPTSGLVTGDAFSTNEKAYWITRLDYEGLPRFSKR